MSKIIIAVDAMGGDYGPSVTIPAAINCLKQFPDVHFLLVGSPADIQLYLKDIPKHLTARISIEPAQDVDVELSASRSKNDSPITVGVDLVQNQSADAFVSAGHTANLMSRSTFKLKRIPGINRPAICSAIPSEKGFSLLLDVGANLESNAENLHQFAVMGNMLAQSISDHPNPKISLLNIGVEAVKGTSEVKQAAELLQADSELNYTGFIEGLNLFSGEADVIVCDGLTGNVALKASEGAALFVTHTLQQSVRESKFKQLAASFSAAIFKDVKEKLNPQKFNGAVLLGVQGVIVKSHGHADIYGFTRALEQTVYVVRAGLIDKMRAGF